MLQLVGSHGGVLCQAPGVGQWAAYWREIDACADLAAVIGSPHHLSECRWGGVVGKLFMTHLQLDGCDAGRGTKRGHTRRVCASNDILLQYTRSTLKQRPSIRSDSLRQKLVQVLQWVQLLIRCICRHWYPTVYLQSLQQLLLVNVHQQQSIVVQHNHSWCSTAVRVDVGLMPWIRRCGVKCVTTLV